jgi:hypothetical protein
MDMPETSTPSRLQQLFVQLRDDLQQCIIGQPHLIDCLLVALLADGHLLVEGAPGLAKTTAVKALAARIEADFHRVQFTPDLLPADLTGTDVFRPQSGSFEFERGPLFHNIVLADEINRAPAKVQSALLEAMAEQQITVGRSTWQLPELFMVMATQNPIEQEGTFTLPEAQLDRFLMHVTIGYPDAAAEHVDPPQDITYDTLSIWRGNEIYDYPLGGAVPEKKTVTHAEDPEFTQEMADAFAATATAPAPVEDAEPAEAAPAADAGEGSGHRPWHGVLAPEAAPSGDDRQFAERMLTMRDLPLPLKAMFVDDDGHKGSVVVGRIDRVWRDAGLIKAEGIWDITPDAERAAGMVERRMWRGVSVDLDAVRGQLVEAAEGAEPTAEYTQGRISSATMCAIPAFAEAFVRNGTWADYDGQPMPTGAMNEIPDVEAVALVASAFGVKKISADYFRNPMLTEPTPLSLGEDGHIFGHIGAWDACHIGFEVCTTVPPSNTDYAYFLTGQVFTDAGPVAVGQITLGKADIGGHAPDGISLNAAIAHYDRTGTAVADITVGEDEFGVWFSGKLRDKVTEDQIHELFAAGLSGDWRGVRYRGSDSMELIAALAVNVQGFPIPRTRFALDGDRQVSLVAAGMLQPKAPTQLDPAFKAQMDLYFAQKKRNEEALALSAELRRMQYDFVTAELTSLKGK